MCSLGASLVWVLACCMYCRRRLWVVLKTASPQSGPFELPIGVVNVHGSHGEHLSFSCSHLLFLWMNISWIKDLWHASKGKKCDLFGKIEKINPFCIFKVYVPVIPGGEREYEFAPNQFQMGYKVLHLLLFKYIKMLFPSLPFFALSSAVWNYKIDFDFSLQSTITICWNSKW